LGENVGLAIQPCDLIGVSRHRDAKALEGYRSPEPLLAVRRHHFERLDRLVDGTEATFTDDPHDLVPIARIAGAKGASLVGHRRSSRGRRCYRGWGRGDIP